MNREDHLFVEAAEAFEDPPEPLRHGIGLAMHGRDDVGARLEVERVEHVRPSRGEGSELERRVEHHVADDFAPARDALGRERLRRVLVRGEENRGQLVDLDAVPFLGHRQVTAAEPRLDVSLADSGVVGRERAGQRRVRVAEDEHDVRALGADRFADPGPHRRRVGGVQIEPVARLREPQLVEEDLRQLGIVVLPRMQDDLVDSVITKRNGERRRLDKLRAVSDDRENLQGVGTLGALRAVSSVGRAGDS